MEMQPSVKGLLDSTPYQYNNNNNKSSSKQWWKIKIQTVKIHNMREEDSLCSPFDSCYIYISGYSLGCSKTLQPTRSDHHYNNPTKVGIVNAITKCFLCKACSWQTPFKAGKYSVTQKLMTYVSPVLTPHRLLVLYDVGNTAGIQSNPGVLK